MSRAWFTINPWYIALLGFAREDVKQTYKLCAILAERTGEDKRKIQRREFWRLARDLGVSSAYQGRYIPEELEAEFIAKENISRERCVVCNSPAPYCDPDWGRLCRRHAMTVRGRRKRYNQWIAKGCTGKQPKHPRDPIANETPIPKNHQDTWKTIRAKTSHDEWETLRQWARGKYTEKPTSLIARLQKELENSKPKEPKR